MSATLEFIDLEKAYDLIAEALDEVGPTKEALFLTKLCITLAHNIEDIKLIEESISIARLDLAH